MADRKTIGRSARRTVLATSAAALLIALCLPQVGFPGEVEEGDAASSSAPQVSQQVPLDVETPQLVGVAPLGEAESSEDSQVEQDAPMMEEEQVVTLTFHIEDEPSAVWPDAVELEATKPRSIEAEAGVPLGELAPPAPTSSDEGLVFEGWQTEDFSRTYSSEELPTVAYEESAELFAVFAQAPDASEVETRASAGWTKFGTCEWRIDAGKLEIRPENGAASGKMSGTAYSEGVPWYSQAAQITSVVVWPGVEASWNQSHLFAGCQNLVSVTITASLGSEVRNLSSMFDGCSSLTSVVLPASLGPNVENLSNMFNGCSSLSSLTIPDGFAPKLANASWMFGGCSNIASLSLPSEFGSSSVGYINGLFEGCTNLVSISYPSAFGSSAIGISEAFKDCSKLENLSLPAGFGSSAEDLDEVFSGCSNLKTLILPEGFGSKAISAQRTFSRCSSLRVLSLPSGFASLAEDVSGLFEGCSSLTSIDISSDALSTASNMSSVFYGCSSLSSLSLPQGFGSSVTETWWMFRDCTSLTSVSLPEGFGKQVVDAQEMFAGCSKLTSVAWPAGFCSKSESMYGIFSDCVSLNRVPDNFTFGQDPGQTRCFYAYIDDTSDLLPMLYSGSNQDVISYDWESDGRVLNPVMSGTVSIEGGAYANQVVSATAEVPYFAKPAYQWYMADTPGGDKQKLAGAGSASVDLSKLSESAIVGKYLFCGVSDAGGLYQGVVYSEPVVVGIASGTSGDCAWRIEHDGAFSLVPTDGSSGTLPDTSADAVPWSGWATRIVSVEVDYYVYGSESLNNLFAGCINLKTVDLPGNLGYRVATMANMFAGCSKLTSVNIDSPFGDGTVDMQSMFAGCSKLASIGLPSGFGTSAENVSFMFEGCTNLSEISFSSQSSTGFGYYAVNASSMLKDCSSLTSLALPSDFGYWLIEDMSSMFEGCSGLQSLTLPSELGSNWTLRNTSSMFKGCSNLSSLSFSGNRYWEDVTNIASMFEGCSKLTSLAFPENFAESATDMSSLFKGCANLSGLAVPSYFGNQAEDTSSMFEGCARLTDGVFAQDGMSNLGGSTKKTTSMFQGCTGLTSLTLLGYFGDVEDASYMFQGCSNLALLDMSEGWFDPPLMAGMLKDCVKLSDLNVQYYFGSSATDMTEAFANCPSLTKIPKDFSFGNTTPETRKRCFAVGSPFSPSNLLLTFYAGKDTSLATYDWASDNRLLNPPLTGTVAVSGKLYANQSVTATASGLPSGVTAAYQWYVANTPDATKTKIDGATSASLNLAALDASTVVGKRLFCEVTDGNGLYTTSLWSSATGIVNIACGTSGNATTGCAWTIDHAGAFVVAPQTGSLGTLGELAWNAVPWSSYAQQITSATVRPGVAAGGSVQSMFSGCTKLGSANLAGLSTPKAADMTALFSGCSALKQVTGLSGLAASKAEQMFQGCSSLASLDLAGFDTSSAKSLTGMFMGCSKLASLDASPLSTSSATQMDSMFKGCTALSSVKLPDGFVGASCTTVASMFEGCPALSVIPENFSFGTDGKTVTVDRCFFVGDPYTAGNRLATTYLGADKRVAAYDWGASHRVLAAWNLQGEVSLSVAGNVWRQGATATASAKFDPPANGAQPSYQWKRSKNVDGSDAVDIAGATSATYALGSDDVGAYLVCAAKATGTGARGEVVAVAPQPVAAAQVSVTVPGRTSVAISSTGMVSVPDASVYAVGNPSGEGGSTGAIRLKGVRLTLQDARYPGGTWSLGTKDDADAYIPAGTFAVAPGSAYAVQGALAVPVGGTMPLQWAADLVGGGIGPEFAALLADAQGEDGAVYGTVVFTVEYASEEQA